MNGYVCFWGRERCEIMAESTFSAQQKAERVFQSRAKRKKVRKYDISVVLAEKNGKQVTHQFLD